MDVQAQVVGVQQRGDRRCGRIVQVLRAAQRFVLGLALQQQVHRAGALQARGAQADARERRLGRQRYRVDAQRVGTVGGQAGGELRRTREERGEMQVSRYSRFERWSKIGNRSLLLIGKWRSVCR